MSSFFIVLSDGLIIIKLGKELLSISVLIFGTSLNISLITSFSSSKHLSTLFVSIK